MRSAEGRDKIAANLLKAFTTYKNRYDRSTGSTTSAKQDSKTVSAPEKKEEKPVAVEPEVKQVEEGSAVYGIQVLATSRRMSSGDSFFRGYETMEVQVGNLYKYLLVPDSSLDKVREDFKSVSKKYPGCFIVRKEGETLTRIH